MNPGPCYVNDSGFHVHRFDPADTDLPCGCGERRLADWRGDLSLCDWGWSLT